MKQCVPAVGAKIWCLYVFLSRSESGALCVLGGYNVNKCCLSLWVDFDCFYRFFFRRHCPFQMDWRFLILLLGGATVFVKLQSNVVKSPKKSVQSLCAQLCIDSRKILIKFNCSSFRPRTLMWIYTKFLQHVTI